MSSKQVAVVAFDGISPFHLAVPCVVFGDAHPGVPGFRLTVCAATAGPLRTSGGFDVVVHDGLAALEKADIIIVPSWHEPGNKPPELLLDLLVAAHQRGALVVGLCVGAYVLAEAGLLNGRQATTHWGYADDFLQRYPAVQLRPDVLYVEDSGLLTSAGTAAGLDCCLYLLRSLYGAEIANKVARRLVVPPHRQGGQKQFIEQLVPNTQRDYKLNSLMDDIRANLCDDHSLDQLASKASMSRRTLSRRFQALTGMSFGAWLQAERLRLATRLLETGDLSVERIAAETGFGSVATFRLHFSERFGVSPTAWRRTFRGS